MTALGTHAVKVLAPGAKRWEFITPNGGTTHLRIHAATMSQERAETQAQYIPEHNPGVKAKVVEL